jgi:predicted RNA-binding protein YlqC (UPF0109 family)
MGDVPDREDGDGPAGELDDDDLGVDDDDLDDGDDADDGDGDDRAGDDADDGDDGDDGDGELVDERERRLEPLDQGALVEVLQFLAKGLVDDPDKVVVKLVERDGGVTLQLTVDQPDMGKVIGRSGRTARALRTLLRAAGTRAGVNTHVEIVEE